MSDNYIYTKESYNYDEYIYSELPYVNIKGNEIQEINNKLFNQYYEIIELKEKLMKYDYFINDNIISLIVKIYYVDALDSYPDVSIYNFNINTGKVLNNSLILDIYDISSDAANENIKKQIKEYYDYEINNGSLMRDCDFDCYMSNTNSIPIDNYQLYIKDNILYAYKELKLNKDFYYDNNSEFNIFNFKIS